MTQHDYNIANAAGATVRADINALAQAIASNNTGGTAPSVTFPNMFWYDSTNSQLKIRNPGNTAWIIFATISGSTLSLDTALFPQGGNGNWYGTNNRIVVVETNGAMDIGKPIDFHGDATHVGDYQARIYRDIGTDGIFHLLNTGGGGLDITPGTGGLTQNGNPFDPIPVGACMFYGGGSAPTNWIFLNGQNLNRTTNAFLFGLLGTAFGAGNGTTTFGVPDIRGRVIAGKDNMGGTSANRLTNVSGSLDGDVLGATGGAETVTLTSTTIPAHTHAADPPSTSLTINSAGGHTHTVTSVDSAFGSNHAIQAVVDAGFKNSSGDSNFGGPQSMVTDSQGAHVHTGTVDIASFTTGSTGTGSAHANVQPTIILTIIMYAGQ